MAERAVRRRWSSRLALAVVSVAMLAAMVPAEAGASPTLSYPFSVSCTPGQCVAVGGGSVLLAPSSTQVWSLSSGQWSATTYPTGAGDHRWLTDVSCPGPGTCVGVGNVPGGGGYASVLTGGVWHDAALPSGTPVLTSVSCASFTWCVAVGGAQSSSEEATSAVAVVWDGTTWSTSDPVPFTNPWRLDAVSCPTSSACVAVGSSGSSPVAESFDGTSWSVTLAPPSNPPPMDFNDLTSVSCPSTSSCVAVGWQYGCCGMVGPLVEVWGGAAWTTPPIGASMDGAGLTGVSCPQSAVCLVVGTIGPSDLAHFKPRGAVGLWNGSMLRGVPGAAVGLPSGLTAVSCTRSAWCVAAGAMTSRSKRTVPLILRWNGTSLARMFAPA